MKTERGTPPITSPVTSPITSIAPVGNDPQGNDPQEFLHIVERVSEAGKRAVARAIELGADQCKIGTAASFARRLVVENKDFTLADSITSQQLSVAVHKAQRKGSATTNTTDPARVDRSIADSLQLAAYSLPDEYLTLPDSKEAPPANKLDFLFDTHTAAVTLDDLQDSAQEALAILKRDPRIALDRLELSVSTSFHGLRNSKGVEQSELQTLISWSFLGMAIDGTEVTGMDYDSGFSFKASEHRRILLEQVREFAEEIVLSLRPAKCPSYRGVVVLSPRALEELVIDFILYHASGRSVMDNKSRWDKSVGQGVVDELLTITDNPLNPAQAGATAYDADGLPTSPKTLIDRGKLALHLHDCYSAKRVGVRSNAMAGGPFALQVAAGDSDLAELLRSAPRVLMVKRFAGNTDPIKGDFSGVAKNSRLFVNGQDAGPVRETMISGNFFELAHQFTGCSRERLLTGSNFLAPYFLWDGVSVSGE